MKRAYGQSRGESRVNAFKAKRSFERQAADNEYDDSNSNSSSSNSSEEDELGVKWTPATEKNFLHTLAYLKRNDSVVYDKNHTFYGKTDADGLVSKEVATSESPYAAWLQGNNKQLANKEEEANLKTLKEFWTDPQLDEGEAFIRKYILSKPYLAEDGGHPVNDPELLGDLDHVEKGEDFENRFNFRFENPDCSLESEFPRTMQGAKEKKKVKKQQGKSVK